MARGDAKKPAAPTKEELVAFIEELNTVLVLDPAITVGKKDTEDDLIEKIKEQAVGNIYEIDFQADPEDDTIPFFSEDADKMVDRLGIEVLPGAPPANNEPEPAPEKSKGKDTKKDEKPVGKGKADKKDEKAAAKPKADAGPKYTRYNAFADAVSAGKTLTLDELDKKTDELYSKNGGNSNVEQAGRINDRCIQVLVALELGEKDGKKFTYTNK